MIKYQQNALINQFLKKILDDQPNKDLQKEIGTSTDNKKERMYKKFLRKSKSRPILNEIINDYLSKNSIYNKNTDIELSYIIQILALINNSTGFISDNKI